MTTRIAAFLPMILAAVAAHGAALTQDVNVQSRADPTSPVIARFKAGLEPRPAPGALASTPAGWMAVEVPGPFNLFVSNNDITKNLDVREGAALMLEARAGSPVLSTMEKGDRTEVLAPRGRWTEVKVEKSVVGYIPIGSLPAGTAQPPASVTSTPAPVPRDFDQPMTITVAPLTGIGADPALASRVGSPVSPGPQGAATEVLARTMQGRFNSSQRPFTPRRPFDFQIDDDAGIRIAYVDLSRVALSEAPEKYVGKMVVVTGVAENSVEARAVVIKVDSLTQK